MFGFDRMDLGSSSRSWCWVFSLKNLYCQADRGDKLVLQILFRHRFRDFKPCLNPSLVFWAAWVWRLNCTFLLIINAVPKLGLLFIFRPVWALGLEVHQKLRKMKSTEISQGWLIIPTSEINHIEAGQEDVELYSFYRIQNEKPVN